MPSRTTGRAGAVDRNDQAGGELEEAEGEAAEELDLGIVAAEEDGPVGDELVEDVQEAGLVGEAADRAGEHVEDGPIQGAEDPLQREQRGAAPSLGLAKIVCCGAGQFLLCAATPPPTPEYFSI
jgi:hypothetical protein